MTTKTKTTKKSGLGAALMASIQDEQKSIDKRFEIAETLIQKKEQGTAAIQTPDDSASGQTESAPEQKPEPSKQQPKKPPVEKVIRDTFTMPPSDYQRIAEVRKECLYAAIEINKSEVVRAGLIALQELPEKKRHEILKSIERMKPGRPV